VIDAGKFAARGRHNELLSSCPLYETMWKQYVGAADTAEEEVVEHA
jgi:ATP-binding cassette subfamily B protein IrtA